MEFLSFCISSDVAQCNRLGQTYWVKFLLHGAKYASALCFCRKRFYWDMVAWLPFDYLALAVLGDFRAGQSVIARVPLLRLLRMV